MTTITGAILIGAEERDAAATFWSVDPATGADRSTRFAEASADDVADASALADVAAPTFRTLAPERRAAFLEAVAEAIAGIDDEPIERAMADTGLPRARPEGECGGTIGQPRLFAGVVCDGGWMDATIDHAMPDRQLPPRPKRWLPPALHDADPYRAPRRVNAAPQLAENA